LKVVYTMFLLFILFILTFSCASNSVYKIAHKHLERDTNYSKLGVWGFGTFWVELYNDERTSWPFDLAVWLDVNYGQTSYFDLVCSKGDIHRYGWNWEKKEFIEFSVMTLKDGRYMTPFQYYDSIVNKKRTPI